MNITIIGSGRLAFNLAMALYSRNHIIKQIYSRNKKTGSDLAQKVKSQFCDKISDINELTDIYIIAITDDNIKKFIYNFIDTKKIIVHTSGSTSIDIFKNKYVNYGVFYPLQTFNLEKLVTFENIPICIEASNDKAYNKLKLLAKTISTKHYSINSQQREKIHIAAVYSCNFVNHLIAISYRILESNNIPTEILNGLLKQTFNNLINQNPDKIQTGPAFREDFKIIDNHINQLANNKTYQDIYNLITKSIIEHKKT